MKTIKSLLFIIISMLIITSCNNNETELIPVTSKIQYDVYIESPNPDYDWWISNIPGPQRDDLVNWIFEMAYNGKLEAFDYYNQPLTPGEVKNIGFDTVYMTLMRTAEPYEMYDTMVVYSFERSDVVKVRFLEEWYYDDNQESIIKKVLAVAPVLEKYDEAGDFIANQPLFWLYFDMVE